MQGIAKKIKKCCWIEKDTRQYARRWIGNAIIFRFIGLFAIFGVATRDRAAATALLRALAPAPDRDAFAGASAAALGAGDSSALVALRFPAKPKRAAGDTKRVPLRERMAAARGN